MQTMIPGGSGEWRGRGAGVPATGSVGIKGIHKRYAWDLVQFGMFSCQSQIPSFGFPRGNLQWQAWRGRGVDVRLRPLGAPCLWFGFCYRQPKETGSGQRL